MPKAPTPIEGRVCGYTPGISRVEIQLPAGSFKSGQALELGDAVRIHTAQAPQPSYEDLLAFARRMAFPDQGDALILDDYRNIARNVVQPDGGLGDV
jgi:hypothetical protein